MVGGCFRFVVVGWNVCRAEGRSVFLVGRCVGEWVDLCFVIEVVWGGGRWVCGLCRWVGSCVRGLG